MTEELTGTPPKLPEWKEEQLRIETVKGKPVCIIPAKKTSTRLPGKNKKVLGGKPLVQHAIDLAKESGLFSMIVVSSDDDDILQMAYESGVFPHNRPEILRGKSVQQKEICFFILGLSQVPKTDVFCLLSAPNPFRTVEELKQAYDLIYEKKANYVMSIVQANPPPERALELKKGYLVPTMGFQWMLQTQKLKPKFYHDGAYIFARREVFDVEFEYGFYGSKNVGILRRPTVDIDTPEEFRYAEYLWYKSNPTIIIPGVNDETKTQ